MLLASSVTHHSPPNDSHNSPAQVITGKDEVDAGAIPKLRDGAPVKNKATGLLECDPNTALRGMSPYKYNYLTPAAFYASTDAAEPDPADTSAAATCVLDKDGVAREVRST